MLCPLCESSDLEILFSPFFKCLGCDLHFKDRKHALDFHSQKPRYETHQNNLTPDYRKFLNRLWTPLKNHVSSEYLGLDYGCGPTTAFAEMLSEENYKCESFDPIFRNHPDLLSKTYDYVFCSEVVEHFIEVNVEWKKIIGLVKPGGHIGIMTAFVPQNLESFKSWYYHRDPTHISFYNPKSLNWIAQKHDLQTLSCENNVAIFRLK